MQLNGANRFRNCCQRKGEVQREAWQLQETSHLQETRWKITLSGLRGGLSSPWYGLVPGMQGSKRRKRHIFQMDETRTHCKCGRRERCPKAVSSVAALWPGWAGDRCLCPCASAGLPWKNRRNNRVGEVCMSPSLSRLPFCMTMGPEQGLRDWFLVLAPPLPFTPSSLAC